MILYLKDFFDLEVAIQYNMMNAYFTSTFYWHVLTDKLYNKKEIISPFVDVYFQTYTKKFRLLLTLISMNKAYFYIQIQSLLMASFCLFVN